MPKPCPLLLTVLLWLPGLPGTALAQETGALPAARIAVSPPRLEIDLDAGRSTEALYVINLSDEETHLSVSVAHWDLDENNKVRNIAPTEQSLDQWMVINPLEFTIPPHEQQTIRFAVRPRIQPEPGEHRAMIYLEQQPDAAGGSEKAISILYRLGVAVYGLSGHIDRRGRIRAIRHSQSDENHFLVVDTISEGNASVRLTGQYGIWRKTDFPGEEAAVALLDPGRTPVADTLAATGSLPELPILPGTERSIPTRLQWPSTPGNYILFVNGKIAGKPFTKNLEISVP